MHDLIIIGAGPAGLTAALYAGRFRLKTAILEKMIVGGQIILSGSIENYPGFPGGVSTLELIDRFKKQVEDVGIEIENNEALEIRSVSQSGSLFYEVKTADSLLQTKSVIIASGASPKRLGVGGEEKLTGRGVSYCGTCDGPLFKNKDIVVVGGGDRALEEAIFLTSYAKKVNLIHRRSALRASKIVEEKARENSKINFILDTVVEEIRGENKVEAVKIRNVKTNLRGEIICQGGFIFVGINPNTGFLKNLLEIDEKGFIITDSEMQTSIKGIFACGDCRQKSLWQVVGACADGATAAASAQRYLL
jgi:thioredoxin reductase (NADPH)